MIFISNKVKLVILFILQVSVTKGQIRSSDQGLNQEDNPLENENKPIGEYIVSVDSEKDDNDKRLFYYNMPARALHTKDDSNDVMDKEIYDDVNIMYPDEWGEKDMRRRKREFLQCMEEEPIIYLCTKSCVNIFATFCYGYHCPPGLKDTTQHLCKKDCLRTLKEIKGEEYIDKD